MRTLFYCMAALVLVLGVAHPVEAQTTQGKIVFVGVGDRIKANTGGEIAHGISNVGVGAQVVMKPYVVWSTGPIGDYHDILLNVTSVTWTLTSKPATSVLSSTDIVDTLTGGVNNLVVSFKPDVAGTYTISMTATTDTAGVANASVTVKAADFVGIGARDLGETSNYGYANFNCAPCHSSSGGALESVFSGYAATNHSTSIIRKLNEDGGHFADYCLRCHTTGFNATAVNDGFDERAAALGWTVPHNGAGVYDSLLQVAKDSATAGNDSLLAMMSQFGIQCETCHGPAGEHKKTGDPSLMAKRHSSQVCAPCHFSSDRHPRGYSWESSLHAVSTINGDSPSYMNRSSCSRCHVGQGFVNETIKGNPAPSNGYPDGAPIGCVTCHNPHDASGEHQLYRLTVREACTGCHTTRLSSYSGLHHSHQGQMIQGTETAAFAGDFSQSVVDVAGWELPGYTYNNSFHSEIEERCVQCHMAPSPDFDPTFASPDTLLNAVGGHTWKIKWTDANGTHVNNSGCADVGCHGGTVDQVTAFVETSQNGIKALLDTLKNYLPLRPPTGSNPNLPKYPQDNTLTPIQKAAAYNWWFVNNDLSFGVHNNTYARGLLESSIEQVKLGAGAAQIASIKDVPGDQGRRVQVVWNKFPAEDLAFGTLVEYGVWREDQQIGTKVTPKKNYIDMFQSGVVGEQYSVSGLVWTYLARVPASNFALYSYVAETLSDSTAGGTAAANFKIVGYATNSAAVYSSQPFSGYSVDNLPPLRVVEFAVNVGTSGADLTWKPNPEDKDVAKYLVYRGTTSNFTPGTPLTETTSRTFTDPAATSGMPYWYVVRAVDQAGNLGELSSPMGTTNIEQTEGLPTTYALGQNYPNPFNPTTTINFSLPEAGTVVLQVYTISGELVTTLAQGEFPAGNFKATWTGTDRTGSQVASGMYIYRLQSGTFTSVKKMIMLK